MMSLSNHIRAIVFALVLQGASANFFSTFRFSRLLYAFNICSHQSGWCPAPPCDLKSFHDPICNNYLCEKAEPRGKQCVFIGNCNGDADCIATAQYLGTSADYYGDASAYNEGSYAEQEQELQADASESDTYSTSASGGQPTYSSRAAWWPYALLGTALAAIVGMTVWRRRRAIAQGALSEELAPNGTKKIRGAVARRHGKSQVDYNLA